MKNLHSSGKTHCLETSSSAHHTRQNTTVPPWSPLPLQRQNSRVCFQLLQCRQLRGSFVPLLLAQGESINFSRPFYFVPITHSWKTLLNSPSPYIWAIQTLCSSQPALNNARKLADGCWQQARLCPHSTPVRKQKTSGDTSAN